MMKFIPQDKKKLVSDEYSLIYVNAMMEEPQNSRKLANTFLHNEAKKYRGQKKGKWWSFSFLFKGSQPFLDDSEARHTIPQKILRSLSAFLSCFQNNDNSCEGYAMARDRCHR